MELIILIILGLVSMLFNKLGSRQEETPRQQRPVSSGPSSQIPKKLEDFTRELFEEFQEPERKNTEPMRQVEVRKPVSRSQKPEPSIEKVPEEVSSRRPAAIRTTRKSVEKKVDIFPDNEQDLLQAFIFSEVIGPPKSKR